MEVYSPVSGKLMALKSVADRGFSSGKIGDGVAILPDSGRIVSPVSGVVSALFSTGHAVAVRDDTSGIEILIHIGINTVSLNGKYFESHVKKGDSVKVGDLLIEFDNIRMAQEGYDITVPVVIPDLEQPRHIVKSDARLIGYSRLLMTICE